MIHPNPYTNDPSTRRVPNNFRSIRSVRGAHIPYSVVTPGDIRGIPAVPAAQSA
jgi:hypothetical protein